MAQYKIVDDCKSCVSLIKSKSVISLFQVMLAKGFRKVSLNWPCSTSYQLGLTLGVMLKTYLGLSNATEYASSVFRGDVELREGSFSSLNRIINGKKEAL